MLESRTVKLRRQPDGSLLVSGHHSALYRWWETHRRLIKVLRGIHWTGRGRNYTARMCVQDLPFAAS